MPSNGWAMVTKNVHQLKLLQLFRFDDRGPSMARVIKIYQKHVVVITLPAPDSKCPMDSSPRGVPTV